MMVDMDIRKVHNLEWLLPARSWAPAVRLLAWELEVQRLHRGDIAEPKNCSAEQLLGPPVHGEFVDHSRNRRTFAIQEAVTYVGVLDLRIVSRDSQVVSALYLVKAYLAKLAKSLCCAHKSTITKEGDTLQQH